VLEPFGEQTEPGPVPEHDLDQVGPGSASEYEQMAGEWILPQHALHQHGEPVDALAHVDVAQRQVHLYALGEQCRHGALSWPRAAPSSMILTATNVGTAVSSCFHRNRMRAAIP
jgi:hypothetical protein